MSNNNFTSPLKLAYTSEYKVNKPGDQSGEYISKEIADALYVALEQIANWRLPETGTYWDNEKTRPVSYGAAYGSNGERDYIKSIAAKALIDANR